MAILKRRNGDVVEDDPQKTIRQLAEKNSADLSGAYLRSADLRSADLSGADLSGADLRSAKIEFYTFPSIRLLSSIHLGSLSETLALELMRRDAYAHPHPERFETWANGGNCPYQNEEYFWHFDYKNASKFWSPGNPQIKDSDLIVAICKEKGWKIKGYLE